MHIAEFGVVILLFLIGLELQPSLLWRMRLSLLGLGGLQVGVTAVLFLAAALLVMIGIAILMTKVGLSPALGTFLAGVVLA